MEDCSKELQNYPLAFFETLKSIVIQLLHFLTFLFSKILGLNKPSEVSTKKLKQVKDIPGPFSLPIFGTTLTSSALKMKDLVKANQERMEMYGPIVKEEYLFGFPMIHILDSELIEQGTKAFGQIRPGIEILEKYRSIRTDKYDAVGIAMAQGEQWERLHSAVAPFILSPKFIREITLDTDTIVCDFVQLLKQGEFQDFTEVCGKLAAESAFFSLFGLRVGFIQEDAQVPQRLKVFLETHELFWKAVHKTTYRLPIWNYLPVSWWSENVKHSDILLDIVDELIKEIESPSDVGLLKDLLKNDNTSYKTKRLLALDVILGSTDTVISTLTFMLYHISKDERVATKLFEEIKELLPTKESELGEDFMKKLPYLKACMTETHRISSTAPNVMRITEKALELGGYYIPPYSLVIAQWSYAAMQEKAFYKAKEFLPERWIYDEGGVPPFEPHKRKLVLPFGYGRRACPGSRIVKQLGTIALARIFRTFEVKFEQPLESKYEWLIQPVNPVKIKFIERDD